MRVFINNPQGWSEKFNFVDKNNVFVGFDSEQWCCEDFGYYFSPCAAGDAQQEGERMEPTAEQLEPYVFDKSYHKIVSDNKEYIYSDKAVFRLIAPDKQDLYLYLYNFHEGYYGHGFEFCDGEVVMFKGVL